MRSIPSPEFLYPCGVRGGMTILISVCTGMDSPETVTIASPAMIVMISSHSCVWSGTTSPGSWNVVHTDIERAPTSRLTTIDKPVTMIPTDRA